MNITNIEIQYQNIGGDTATQNYKHTGDIEFIADEPACIKSITLTTDTKWTYSKTAHDTHMIFNLGELVISYANDNKDVCLVSGDGMDGIEQFHGDIQTLIREMQIPITPREAIELSFTAMKAQMRLQPMKLA